MNNTKTDISENVIIGGIPILRLSRRQWVKRFVSDMEANLRRDKLPAFMTSANGNILSLAARNREFRRLLVDADGIDADGMSLVLASRLLCPKPLPERVATTDFFHDLAALSNERELKFFLLGATASECSKACGAVRQRYPSLRLAGHHGYFSDEEENQVVARINAFQPDVLWVSLGVPREQSFVIRNRHRFGGITWIKTSGGLLNFLSGTNSRAPRLMQDAGLEWLYRLGLEPRRLFRRYAFTNIHALYLMLTQTPLPGGAAPAWRETVETEHETEHWEARP